MFKRISVITLTNINTFKENHFYERLNAYELHEHIAMFSQVEELKRKVASALFVPGFAFDLDFIAEKSEEISYHLEDIIKQEALEFSKEVLSNHLIKLPYKGFKVTFNSGNLTASVEIAQIPSFYKEEDVEFMAWYFKNMTELLGNQLLLKEILEEQN